MIERIIKPQIEALLKDYPGVTLVGPRQCGKTTLAKTLASRYFDLEQESGRLQLDLAWDSLAAFKGTVVLDEVQADPAVFPRLRGLIDETRGRGLRFLLLGSVSPALMKHVSESLAGRLALCEMAPFLAEEPFDAGLDNLWLRGGFPDGGILNPSRYPRWQSDYLQLLAQRDLPNWGLVAPPQAITRLLKMLAARNGTAWNASETGKSLGLSYHTVNRYADYLEGAFLIRRLPAYHANLGKRLTKAPKLYWRDTGLLHSLLGGPNWEDLLSSPWVGLSWEGFVIEQVLASLAAAGRPHEAHYFRTSDGHEIDLVLKINGRIWAIEVKLTTRPSPEDMERLNKAADLIKAGPRVLVTRAKHEAQGSKASITNLPGLLAMLHKA